MKQIYNDLIFLLQPLFVAHALALAHAHTHTDERDRERERILKREMKI